MLWLFALYLIKFFNYDPYRLHNLDKIDEKHKSIMYIDSITLSERTGCFNVEQKACGSLRQLFKESEIGN